MKHGITFERKGTMVEVCVATDLPLGDSEGCYFNFSPECGTTTKAELLLRYLRTRHEKTIQNIRENEFFSGWKQAKAKKHGKSFFTYWNESMRCDATWMHI